MKARFLIPLFLITAILASLEVALELRAHRAGRDSLLFGASSRQVGSAAPTEVSLFGPTQDFPFRSRVVPLRRDFPTKRIWIASSSYAEDVYLNPSATFPGRLASTLSGPGFPVEVLNASRAGNLIANNISDLKRLGAEWQPDFAILYQMSLEINDLSAVWLSPSRIRTQGTKEGETQAMAAPQACSMGWAQRFVEKTALYNSLNLQITTRVAQSKILSDRLGAEAEQTYRNRVQTFIDTCRALGVKPVLCTFAVSHDRAHLNSLPGFTRRFLLRYNLFLSPNGWIDAVERFNKTLKEIGRQNGVLVIDLASSVSGHPEYFRDFVHFTVAGHARVAEVMSGDLRMLLISPSSSSASADR